jgi:glycosyltransferase involved in cell wall biosynthesis
VIRSRKSKSSSFRIANVCRVLWNGGVQRTAIAQTESLRSLGYDVDLIFLRRVDSVDLRVPKGTIILPATQRQTPLNWIQQTITSWFAQHRGSEATVDLDRMWAARSTLRHYDVIVYNDQYAALMGIWNRIIRRQPYVMMFHEFFPKVSKRWSARILNHIADWIDVVSILVAPQIVATSSLTKERLDRIAPGRARLGRLGAPASLDVPAPSSRDRRSVFSITVWDRGRHPELYVELARKREDFRFVLAGIWADPRHLAEIQAQATRLPNLTITGPISEVTRLSLETQALLYLRYGFDESGPGLGGLEALAAGSIVICNRGLGLSEVIQNGRNGFILERPDVQETSDLLERINRMSDEELAQISESGQAVAREYSWESHGRVLLEAIRAASNRDQPDDRSDAKANLTV